MSHAPLVSILKVIDPGTSQSRLCCTAFVPSEHRLRLGQPSCQSHFAENRALKKELKCQERSKVAGFREFNGELPDGCFFMLSCLIFNSSDDRGIPSLGSRPIWPRNFSVASRQCRLNELLLIVLDGLNERTG